MAKKELSNDEHNAKVFAEIKKLQDKIGELKATLKEVEPPKQATLAECNNMAQK